MFRSWLSSIEQEASRRLFAGELIPGKKLVLSQKNRRWTDPEKVQRRLARLGLEEDEYAPRGFASPAQVEKLLKQHKLFGHWNKIAEFTERPAGAPVMADEHDPRPEYVPGSEFDIVD